MSRWETNNIYLTTPTRQGTLKKKDVCYVPHISTE